MTKILKIHTQSLTSPFQVSSLVECALLCSLHPSWCEAVLVPPAKGAALSCQLGTFDALVAASEEVVTVYTNPGYTRECGRVVNRRKTEKNK